MNLFIFYRPNCYILLAGAKNLVVLRVFLCSYTYLKRLLRKKSVDLQMHQMLKKVMRESNKIPAQENASMKKIAKRITVQKNLLLVKNSRRKQLPKKKLGKAH